ncbi:hypothetical protein, partial [Rhizobium rhizogenes]|uniref:hypothetical protein n=1 Tax=Rhizobium rhizogenes TaxID=359 RepID=UPI0002FB8308
MSKVAFKQADLERVFKAAAKAGSIVQMDMKSLIVTVIPPMAEQPVDEYGNPLGVLSSANSARRGKEHWDED